MATASVMAHITTKRTSPPRLWCPLLSLLLPVSPLSLPLSLPLRFFMAPPRSSLSRTPLWNRWVNHAPTP